MSGVSQVRLDKWLWAVRIFKTRTAANEACAAGRVKVNGSQAKPAERVKVGDVVVTRERGFSTTYRVEQVIDKRVGAEIAAGCVTDVTPPQDRPEAASMAERVEAAWAKRSAGSGRPTKRDRRQMEKFLNAPRRKR